MATDRPRLTVTLTPALHRTLSNFSELSGESMGGLIVQFMEQAAPQLDRIAVMMQAIKQAKPEAVDQMKRHLQSAAAALESHQKGVMGTLELFSSPALPQSLETPQTAPQSAAEGRDGATARSGGKTAGKKRQAAASDRNEPPPSNRGVGTSPAPAPASPKVTPIRSRRRV